MNKLLRICLLVIVVFLVAEVLARTLHYICRDVPFFRSVGYFKDPELGWKGKLVWGDPSTQRYKIFVIGDSFTRGHRGVRENCMYYNVIKDSLDVEMFVYGGGGYGTLQEYLALDKYFDKIQPDLVILQVCNNDFINNSFELESASFCNRPLHLRPYLIDGKIEYRFPVPLEKPRMFLLPSRFFYLLFNRMDKFLAILHKKGLLRTVERDINEKRMDFEDFRKAVGITNDLVVKIKERIGTTPITAFTAYEARGHETYSEQFRRIFKENDIPFIEDIPAIMRREEVRGVRLRLKDGGHWNEAGHQICGEVLTEALKQKGLIKERRQSWQR